MTNKTRRYLMSLASVIFMFIAGQNAQSIANDSESGVMAWVALIASLVAGIAGILAVNQYANREVAAAQGAAT
jgi:hypothetical protein